MGKVIELKAGDPCPNCGGTMVVDEAQKPATLKDRNARNAHNSAQAARFAARVDEKAEEFGIIHKCERCGYRARYQPAGVDESGEGESGKGRRRQAAHA